MNSETQRQEEQEGKRRRQEQLTSRAGERRKKDRELRACRASPVRCAGRDAKPLGIRCSLVIDDARNQRWLPTSWVMTPGVGENKSGSAKELPEKQVRTAILVISHLVTPCPLGSISI
jgi:hypothetical protein